MRSAGFAPALLGGHVEPGIWHKTAEIAGQEVVVPVDLIVPEAVATGGGRRSARLGPHGKHTARRAPGLEATLVDHAPRTIAALEPDDDRAFVAQVAGPAALLVAKAHKIHDRLGASRADRLVDKDAADVFRLMQTTAPQEVGATLGELARHAVAGPASAAAIDHLERQFGRRGSAGVAMAIRALRLAIPAARIEAVAVAYMTALLEAAHAAQ